MKLNLVNICLSIFLVFLMVFFLLLPHFRKSKIEALNPSNYARKGSGFYFPTNQREQQDHELTFAGEDAAHMSLPFVQEGIVYIATPLKTTFTLEQKSKTKALNDQKDFLDDIVFEADEKAHW